MHLHRGMLGVRGLQTGLRNAFQCQLCFLEFALQNALCTFFTFVNGKFNLLREFFVHLYEHFHCLAPKLYSQRS